MAFSQCSSQCSSSHWHSAHETDTELSVGTGAFEASTESVYAVVIAGWWRRTISGPVVVIGGTALERMGSVSGGLNRGDVVVLSAPQTSREGAISAIRTCQGAGAAAVILHVGAVPAPFPLLEHFSRDYGDVMIPCVLLPREALVRLQAEAEKYCSTSPAVATAGAAVLAASSSAPAASSGKVEQDTAGQMGANAAAAVAKESGTSSLVKGSNSAAGVKDSGTPGDVGASKGTRVSVSSGASPPAAKAVPASAHGGAGTATASRSDAPHAQPPAEPAAAAAAAVVVEEETGGKAKLDVARTEHVLICTVTPPMDCRREMIVRAVPILRRMHEDAARRVADGTLNEPADVDDADAADMVSMFQSVLPGLPAGEARRRLAQHGWDLQKALKGAAREDAARGAFHTHPHAAAAAAVAFPEGIVQAPGAQHDSAAASSGFAEGVGKGKKESAEGAIGCVAGQGVGEEELERRQELWRQRNFRAHVAHVLRLLGSSPGISRTVSGRGVRILAMDGGGIRGLVLVELLRKLEANTGKRITELFDVICGTSAGGLLAIALLLGRSLEDIEEQFWRISSLVFRKGWFTTAQQLTYTGSKY